MMKKFIKTALCVMSAIMLFAGCGNSTKGNDGYVLKINDEEVSKGEFMVYLNEARLNFESVGGSDIWETDFEGMTAEDVAKNSAINALELVKVSNQKANELGVSLTEDEISSAKSEAEKSFETLGEYAENNGITLEDVENTMIDQTLYSKVYNSVTSSFEVSEADFNAYYESVKGDLQNYYKKYTIKSIFVSDKVKAEEVISKYNSGTDFDTLFDEYEEQEGMINQSETTYKGTLESLFGVEFDVQAGQISSALDGGDGYYIIKVENIEESTEEELKSMAEQMYTENAKQQLFTDEYKKWSENVKIEKNDEILNQIKVNQ
ncbi:hypothetical protein B5E58_07920 [Tyzzerella sp. An114]|uniref:peptidyl-prolyl cis-trans isomerase n=1 Tax=Tyzzerella sp. An114 TaxID=1965545 RepID=UPI000B445E10|nr:peptidyl-prolyl cis-trans isomerase [Tyzzerella sp. An114]OUQ58532.1 hypothetical protein B5E58_07920 [Tyzzerella sp. An114]